MKTLFRKELMIGLTVLVMLLILFFGIDYLKGINVFHPANYYYATYENVEGLAQSAPVTVNGYKVGLVREIEYEFDNPGHIRVELSLDKQLKVPRGSRAVLTTDMLGTSTIALELASGDSNHEVGDRLIAVRAGGLMEGITGDMMPKIDSLLTAVTALASNPALANSIGSLEKVMSNLETTTTTLTSALRPRPRIVDNASATMTDVRTIAANLNRLSADLADVAAAVKVMPLDSTMNNINEMSRNLLVLSQQLNDPNSSLGLLMNDPSLYHNLNNSAAHIDSLLIDVKRQPKRYIPPIKIF